MTGIAIEINLDGAGALQKKLNNALARVTHMRPLMEAIGGYVDFSTHQRFITETGPDGLPWKQSKRARREGGKTLTLTARLFSSFQPHATDTSVEEGTNVIYAAMMHFGGTVKRQARRQTIYRKVDASGALGNRFVKRSKSNFASDHDVGAYEFEMPARPILGINAKDEGEIMRIVDDYVMGAFQ
ncbi:MAG: phage virion morphogenesis protein [Rhizobiales bacterium]|nr:phage virion morphogenesis protein [Hyphomicrobiales bacterium]